MRSVSGSGPSDSSNSWNSSGAITPPSQVIRATASVICLPSSSVTGVVSARRSMVKRHPGVGRMVTDGTTASSGKATSSLVVLALLSSLGTRKASFTKAPFVASRGLTVTWAVAGAARPTAATSPNVSARGRAAERACFPGFTSPGSWR